MKIQLINGLGWRIKTNFVCLIIAFQRKKNLAAENIFHKMDLGNNTQQNFNLILHMDKL